MSNLIISIITISGLFLYFCLPAMAAAPFETIPTIVFFLLYPLSVLLACSLILLGHLIDNMISTPEEKTYSVTDMTPSFM